MRECYDRAQDWGRAFSCYYSGNFVTGYKHGYVQKIFASMRQGQVAIVQLSSGIPVYGNANRRRVSVQNYPAYSVSGIATAQATNGDEPKAIDPRYLEDPKPATAQVAMMTPAVMQNVRTMEKNNDSADMAYVLGHTAASKRGGDQAFVY